MAKKNNKFELENIKNIVSEEAATVFLDYDAEFQFHEFDREVQTVYVFESRNSRNSVEFYMLEDLSRRIKEINSRYRVGIMYEERDPEEEEFNEIKQSFLQSSDKDF